MPFSFGVKSCISYKLLYSYLAVVNTLPQLGQVTFKTPLLMGTRIFFPHFSQEMSL